MGGGQLPPPASSGMIQPPPGGIYAAPKFNMSAQPMQPQMNYPSSKLKILISDYDYSFYDPNNQNKR